MRAAIFYLSALAILLPGCAQTVKNEPVYHSTMEQIRKLAEMEAVQLEGQKNEYRTSGAWLGLRVVERKRDQELPREFNDPVLFRSVFPEQGEITMANVIDRMAKLGVQVRIDADVRESKATAAQSAGTSSSNTGSVANVSNLNAYRFSYTKAATLTDLLDHISSKAGVVWDIKGKTVFFFRHETRTFQLAVVPGVQTSRLGADSGSGSGVGGGSAGGAAGATSKPSGTSSLSADASFDPIKNIVAVLNAMKSADGRVTQNETTASITVVDVPEVVERMDRYVRAENARLSQQVYVSVKVYAISDNASTEFGMDWAGLYSSLGGDKRIGLSTPTTGGAGASRVSMGVLSDTRRLDLGLTVLNQRGHAALIDQASDVVMNFRPKTLQSTRSRDIVSKVSVSQVVNAGTQTSTETKVVETGFRVHLTPAIQESGAILMKLSLDMSNLDNLISRTVGTTTMDLADVSKNLSLGEVALRSGQALMIAGLSRDRVNDSTSGTLPGTIVAGGNTRAGTTRERLLMIVTPVLIEGAN